MKNISIWNDIKRKKYPVLNENKNVDILIIGGGITGINCLYNLKNNGLNAMLVEQNRICSSITFNSTGKLSFLQNDLLDKIRSKCGDKIASDYLISQRVAIKKIVEIIKKENIDCDLEKVDSILYTNNKLEIPKLIDLRKFLESNNIKTYNARNNLVKNKYMFKVNDTYMFNPVKYSLGLADRLDNIFEETIINKIEKYGNYYLCYSDKYIIKSKWVIIASHYPYFTFPFLFPFKNSLEKSYISASKYNRNKVSLISYSNPFISIRTYKNNILYLSNSHSIEEGKCDRENFNQLVKKLNDLNLKPNYLWSNIDIITNDGLPYIGKLKGNILISTGYNTWGLATSFLASEILKDIILNKKNSYIKLFNPQRKTVYSFKSIINNTYKNIKGFIKGFTNCNEIKDESISKICPHLGCKLIYNELEETWDCPCHGSRFDKEGNVISGPANKNIKK